MANKQLAVLCIACGGIEHAEPQDKWMGCLCPTGPTDTMSEATGEGALRWLQALVKDAKGISDAD